MENRELRILCVDDTEICRKVLEGYLRQFFNYKKITMVADQDAAFSIFRKEIIDIVFMDVFMEITCGLQLTEVFRSIEKYRNSYAYIIGATGVGKTQEYKSLCINAGMNYVIAKPYDVAEMTDALTFCGLYYKEREVK